MDGIKLTFEPEALEYMVDKAMEYKLGARGLRSIMEAVMIDAQYDAPSGKVKTFVVTEDYAQRQIEKSHLLIA